MSERLRSQQKRALRPGGLLSIGRLATFLFGVGETRDLLRWMAYSFSIGIVAGVGALVFTAMLNYVDGLALGGVAHYVPPRPGGEAATQGVAAGPVRLWALIVLPAVGGLLSGLLVYTFAPEAEGHGTDAVIDAFHNRQGRIRTRVPLIKIVASALTIGTGGSAGREGPIAQIGAGFGSLLGRYLKLSPGDMRRLVVIGAAAGIGAAFRAPLGGALFGASVLYRESDYEHGALMPSFLASVTAYAVFMLTSGAGYDPIFAISPDLSFTVLQLPFYFLLGLAMIPISMLYVWVFYGLRDHFFKRLGLKPHLVPAVGGLLLGLIAWKFPAVLGIGYGWIQKALDNELTIGFMLALAGLKILATALTISSGGSGGVFAPSLVIGGLFGGAIGLALHGYQPEWVADPTAFILVGMAAFFAAAAKVPIASLVLVTEMSGSYALLIPAMLAISVAYMFSGTRWSIYENQVRNRLASPAHRGSYVIDVLEEIPARDVLRSNGQIEIVNPETTLRELYDMIGRTRQSVFPIVDDEGRFVGFVPLDVLREIPPDPQASDLIIAEDLLETAAVVRPDDNLNVALESLLRSGLDELPVVEADERFAGLLNRRDLLAAYYSRLKEIRNS